MNIRSAFICAIVSLTSACAAFDPRASSDESIQATVTSTDQAVQQFLAGRDLDPIEGAWEHDEHSFELIISRNNFDIAVDYDYVGIITRSDQPFWDHGDIKLLLRKTDSASVFDGVWTTRNRAKRNMTFVIENKNLVQASFISNDGNSFFVRIRRINPRLAISH